jgi:hypothetical protein
MAQTHLRHPRSQLSSHLWSAAVLAAAMLTVLVVNRIGQTTAMPARQGSAAVLGGDIDRFIAPVQGEQHTPAPEAQLRGDPFGGSQPVRSAPSIAPGASTPTVSAIRSTTRRLSAILIADDSPVAVIDDEVVRIGDVLPDGGRVSAIRSDRVFILEKNGRMRVLTLFAGRP